MLTNELETFYCATEYRTKKLLLLNRKLYRSFFFITTMCKNNIYLSLSLSFKRPRGNAPLRAVPRGTDPDTAPRC